LDIARKTLETAFEDLGARQDAYAALLLALVHAQGSRPREARSWPARSRSLPPPREPVLPPPEWMGTAEVEVLRAEVESVLASAGRGMDVSSVTSTE
jgi:hypothetical protein